MNGAVLAQQLEASPKSNQVGTPGSHNDEVCIANISPSERRKRLRFGIVCFAISLIVLAILMAAGVDRWWRLPLFLLFAGGATGFLQWREKTCVALARIDSRKLSDITEKISDAGELSQIRKQASRVQREALVLAIVLTIVAVALPVIR